LARGLFVGLTTLDCIYQVEQVPGADDKVVAQDSLLVAGGPATNAAVMFRHLGNEAVVISALGNHPVASLIRADLAEHKVQLIDLRPAAVEPPPLSTILVTAATGERAVISRNAVGRQVTPPGTWESWLEGIDIVLIDGHQMALGQVVAAGARQREIPVVVDAGSWKPGFEEVLPLANYVVASSTFRTPPATTAEETLERLQQWGIMEVAATFGSGPIRWCRENTQGTVSVPQVSVKDTLGAGDFFHGAFCHYRLHLELSDALAAAARVAAHSCQFFGTRAGLSALNPG
jgi:sugar/nucleoside kinase (ribokinase family)